jgi:outer membrane lipoprotein-sorting protein
MNEEHSRDLDNFVTMVSVAFERMRVPETPQGPPTRKLSRLTFGQRVALGGTGLVTLAALILLVLTFYSGGQLSAMERMADRLNEVSSYSYRVFSETTTTDRAARLETTWRETGTDDWQAPNAFRGAEKIVELKSVNGVLGPEKVLEHFVEIFPANKVGLFIDHHRKTFFREKYDPLGSTTYPMEPLKKIREDRPPQGRDLGSKPVAGKSAHGYEVNLTTGDPPQSHDWQVWIDPQTDLPLEVGYQLDDRGEPRTTTIFRLYDFHWNGRFDPGLFEAVPPEGYREVSSPETPPREPAGGERRPESDG